MNRSTERILTTHCGSLARPTGLLDLMRAKTLKHAYDPDAYNAALRDAVSACVRQQADVGLDSVSDGEQGKIGHALYVGERLAGYETPPNAQFAVSSLFPAEVQAFPDYYEGYFAAAMHGGAVAPVSPPTCTGEVAYTGRAALDNDITNLRGAVDALGASWSGEVFMPSVAPSGVGENQYYSSEEEYLFAVADALRTEYAEIVAAGFLLQIDDPFLTMMCSDSTIPIDLRRRRAEAYVEAINRAVKDIPEEKIRFHTCYGINEGPRVNDVPLAEIVDLVLKVKAQAYSFEAANPRHEHEYHVWDEVELPDGKILIPGVISHSTNVVEHPELVAERIRRFADRVGRENVIAGADCGFASQAQYNPEVHPAVVWTKLRALQEGAQIATQALY